MGVAAKICQVSRTCSPFITHFLKINPPSTLFLFPLNAPPNILHCSENVHPPLSQIHEVCVWFVFCAFDVL